MFYESGSILVWVYIDFWTCSPSPIIHSLFTLKVKHLIPFFRSPVLSSAPAKCVCSTRKEVLQRRRQCQKCLREVSVGRERRESKAQGCGCRQCWVFPTGICNLCYSSGVFFINQICCCLLTTGQCTLPLHWLWETNLSPAVPAMTWNAPRLPIKISHPPGLHWGKQVLLSFFSHIFPYCFLISSFSPYNILLLSVIHWQLFYCAFLF